jgi:CRP/FNR family transcriptional regulator
MEKLFLKHFQILEEVPKFILSHLEDKIEIVRLQKGKYIFHELESAKVVYFVIDGIVKIKKNNYKGKEVIVSIKRSGDIFGEATLFQPSDSFLYHETAQALTSVRIGSILRSDFEEIILKSPQLAKNVIQMMGLGLDHFSSIIKDNSLNDVYGKTIKSLVRLGYQYGKYQDEGKLLIDLPLSIQDLANIVGSSRETTSRSISKLREEKLVDMDQRKIIIVNWFNFRSLSKTI